MGRFLQIVAAVLVLASAAAVPPTSSFAQPYADLDANGAVDALQALVERLNAAASNVRRHSFAPAYFQEPCKPTKSDGEATLAPFRIQRREMAAEVVALKARIVVLEKVSSSAIVLSNKGWKVHDQGRFKALDGAYRNLLTALAAKEEELDRMPVQPCGQSQPATPATPAAPARPVAAAPLTPANESQFQDFPLETPKFDDPVTMPAPPKFCSYAERKAWMESVYWPTIDRAKQNALKALATYEKAEQRLRDIRAVDRQGSPRIAEAARTVEFWWAEKSRRMAAHQQLAAIDVPRPVDCGPPSTTTGGAAVTPTTPATARPPTTPQTPQTPQTPSAPLPAGVARPQLETVDVPTLPARFCSESEKLAYLVEVYHPAAAAASRNALRTSAYRKLLSDLAYEALQRGERALAEALQGEHAAFKPIGDAAEALAQRMVAMRDQILKIPVVDCTGKGKSPTDIAVPFPTDRPVTPVPPAPSRPGLPPPNLARPQFERVRALDLPDSFCSEAERVAYMTNVYNPTAAAARANAEKAAAHEARVNGLFTEYMRNEGGPGWAAVKAEQAAFKPIAEAARAEAERLRRLYDAIRAIPIKPCAEDKAWEPVAGPTGMSAGPVSEGVDLFETPVEALPEIPASICDETERLRIEARLGEIEIKIGDRMAEANAALSDLLRRQKAYEAAGRTVDAAVVGEPIDNLRSRIDDLGRQWQALQDAFARLRAATRRECPPPAEDGPEATPARPSANTPSLGFKTFEWPTPPSRMCTPEELLAYRDALIDLHGEIRAEGERLYQAAFLVTAAHVGSLIPTQAQVNLIVALNPGLYDLFDTSRGFFYYSLMQTIDEQLARYAGMLGGLELELENVEAALIYDRLSDDCPGDEDLIGDGPVTSRGGPKQACPPKQGRDPITVGSNSQVGSGAQLRSKLTGIATGALLGALGGGGRSPFGGGGGGSEPQLWSCRIKDSEYTVFDDPLTGVSLKVGAKRDNRGQLVIFSEIAKSPDKGTFQAAFLERPSTGETLAPRDVGPCDLWGEWKLTVSWTKTTYVNGQVVDRQSGGWSDGGFFKIPGALSKADAPDGLWKRMGFSGAQMGAREIGMIFDAPAGGGPLTFVIHVTRPKGDPVTTVPFVLTMTEGPGGFVFTRAEEEPCPPEGSSAATAARPWEPANVAPPPDDVGRR